MNMLCKLFGAALEVVVVQLVIAGKGTPPPPITSSCSDDLSTPRTEEHERILQVQGAPGTQHQAEEDVCD